MFEISEIRISVERVIIFDHENVKFISLKKFYYPVIVLSLPRIERNVKWKINIRVLYFIRERKKFFSKYKKI